MSNPSDLNRREYLKRLAVLPLVGTAFPLSTVFPLNTLDRTAVDPRTAPPENIFRSIGVEPVINCRGTYTIIGGSIERPEVRAAMEAASKDFIQYDELADGIGKRLAELTGAEWGMVAAGCAAALKHVTAACVTGGNPEKLIRIPDLTGFERSEVVLPRHARNEYDHALRNIGVRLVTVDTIEELANALTAKTAMIYTLADTAEVARGPLSLQAIAKVAKPKKVPILVDAAAEVLTIPCVHLERGATVVAYSGGKAMCGPQCAGLLLGQKDILMSAWQASSPHHGPGRDNKVGREEMIGMVAAVEAWKTRDHAAEWKTWLGYLNNISRRVTTVAGVTTSITEPTELSNKSPVLNITWDPAKLNLTGEELEEEVARNKPRIALASESKNGMTSIQITSGQMQPGNDAVVAERLYGILSQVRSPKAPMRTAAANLTGRWDVTIEFFSSTGQHTLTLEQDGNWVKGSHQGDFSSRELVGTIDGDRITLRSVPAIEGDNLPYIFSGTLSGDSFSGQIHLGEYRTAKFTARRHATSGKKERILVPGGPPLATE
jgi:seryl-tRNA(Sec) selenium transferase